jgi:hypothetical protein
LDQTERQLSHISIQSTILSNACIGSIAVIG